MAEDSSTLQRGCPRCGAPVPPANLELHLLRCDPAGVVGSVFGAAAGDQWACAACTFLNAEEQRCCAMCGGLSDVDDAQSPSLRAAVLGSVFRCAETGGGEVGPHSSGAAAAAGGAHDGNAETEALMSRNLFEEGEEEGRVGEEEGRVGEEEGRVGEDEDEDEDVDEDDEDEALTADVVRARAVVAGAAAAAFCSAGHGRLSGPDPHLESEPTTRSAGAAHRMQQVAITHVYRLHAACVCTSAACMPHDLVDKEVAAPCVAVLHPLP